MELRNGNELAGVRGFSIRSEGDPVATYGTDRVCRAYGCETRLSLYNSSSTCWLHEDPRTFVLRVRHGKVSGEAA